MACCFGSIWMVVTLSIFRSLGSSKVPWRSWDICSILWMTQLLSHFLSLPFAGLIPECLNAQMKGIFWNLCWTLQLISIYFKKQFCDQNCTSVVPYHSKEMSTQPTWAFLSFSETMLPAISTDSIVYWCWGTHWKSTTDAHIEHNRCAWFRYIKYTSV